MTTRPEDLRGEALARYETWRTIGLSESSALEQLRRDGLLVEDGFDKAVRSFEALGLSPEAARVAAVGRGGSEAAARESWGRGAAESRYDDLHRQLAETREALRQLTDAELSGPGLTGSQLRAIQEGRR